MERVVMDAWIPAEAVVRFSIIEYNTTKVDELVKIRSFILTDSSVQTQILLYHKLSLPRPVPVEEKKPNTVVLSGMATEFDFVLVERLKGRARRQAAFFIDSWKFLTRNPEKLFLALEYVLASRGKIVIHNASLENGTVSCRRGFLQPAHVDGEILAKLSRQDQGTTSVHRQTLERIAGR
jgi:hypothetical protein